MTSKKSTPAPRKYPQWPSPHEITVLRTLCRLQEATGSEIVEASNGDVPYNQVYILLTRLEKRGCVERVRYEEPPKRCGGNPRPIWAATEFGRKAITAADVLLEGQKNVEK